MLKKLKILEENMTEHSNKIIEVKTCRRNGKPLRAALVSFAVLTVLCGIIYPLAVTGAAKIFFPKKAEGSIITVQTPEGKEIYGSILIGQNYTKPIYLIGRINSKSPTNLSPKSPEFLQQIQQRKEFFTKNGFMFEGNIPSKLVTESASGSDPHISKKAALYQIKSIVQARKKAGWKLAVNERGETQVVPPQKTAEIASQNLNDYSEDFVRQIIDRHTEKKFMGLFGKERVNVLLVNLDLDGIQED